MSFRSVRAAVLVALFGVCGCASPRFVSIGPEGGTIAMPSNTASYRNEAVKMLDEKYPNGWVIDHEGEVVVGQVRSTEAVAHEVRYGEVIERRTVVHDKTEWQITFHPKGVVPTTQTTQVVPPPPPVIQQTGYVEQPVKDIRTLPKEPVPADAPPH